jgi:Family of unknown function (DUF6424)
MSAGTHDEHEDHGWDIRIPDHPPRSDSPEYQASRTRLHQLTGAGTFYGPAPIQDHHGGGLWLKDSSGWFFVRNLAGIEWSAQFCADPARVDELRANAARLYALFPAAVDQLGIGELLATPITDAAGVAKWTDSICNASVPLSADLHCGVMPHGAGVHHYPTPITDIETFKTADFDLFVTDSDGHQAAVVPVAPRGSGDGRVQVLWASTGGQLHAEHMAATATGRPFILDAGHELAQLAFARQR